ncbi:hypothetical protein GOP47_0003275, partial [Adiantum capillus-veneris]
QQGTEEGGEGEVDAHGAQGEHVGADGGEEVDDEIVVGHGGVEGADELLVVEHGDADKEGAEDGGGDAAAEEEEESADELLGAHGEGDEGVEDGGGDAAEEEEGADELLGAHGEGDDVGDAEEGGDGRLVVHVGNSGGVDQLAAIRGCRVRSYVQECGKGLVAKYGGGDGSCCERQATEEYAEEEMWRCAGEGV